MAERAAVIAEMRRVLQVLGQREARVAARAIEQRGELVSCLYAMLVERFEHIEHAVRGEL